MSAPGGDSRLPQAIEDLVEAVLNASGLEFAEGRDDVAQELRAHFEDGLDAGTPPDELVRRFGDPVAAGRRIARTRTGGPRRGGSRSPRGTAPSLSAGWAIVAQAARRLTRAPGFAVVVVLTLALGVGANTAIYTVVDAVLLDELPYAEPDRLVRVYEGRIEDPDRLEFLRVPIMRAYRDWSDVFESVAALYTYRELGADLTDGPTPRRVTVMRVTAGYFETLGVPPALGRTFREEESFGTGESRGSTDLVAPVATISHRLWRDHFGADPAVIGRTIRLDDFPYEVVGVMPARFRNPIGSDSDVWIPQDARLGGSNSYGNYYLSAVARLRDGVGVEAARERAGVLAESLGRAEPDAAGSVPRLLPLRDDMVGESRARMLWILAVAAGLVLLTACLNVANLVLARGLGRDRQLALRSALGSGRGRLLAEILAENALLAALGGVLGVGIGWVGLNALLALAPDALPATVDVRMGWPAFGVGLGVGAFALVVFGLAPALRMSRTAPAEVLRGGDRSATLGRMAKRARDLLVVAQVSAALVLVTGATLLARSLDALIDVPLAIEPEGVLTYEVHLPSTRYASGSERHAFHVALHDRVRDLPGVEAVGATSWLPVDGRYHTWGLVWLPDGGEPADEDPWISSDVRIVAGDYFETLGIEVVRGAGPAEIDYEAEPVVWINESIASELTGRGDPLGTIVWLNGPRRVVGIVEDVPYGARGETSRKLYLPHAQYNDDRNWALIQVVRARSDLGALQESIRAEIAALDGQLVLYRPASFDRVLDGVRAQDRFAAALMGSFAGLALLLSILGTYGVLAGSVSSRTREIGIRMALGADRSEVRRMVLRYAAAITISGVALGLALGRVATSWLESLLFEIRPGDLWTHLGAVGLFVAVGLVSGWIPARRATRVDTVEALSAE